ncbi:hypothetical protein B0H19DRAFT_1247852 [Mycena capillaripes]|nr:hypothetical protein B0H19DRAFT_1247852 [Mycena capillaripes]
MSTPNRSAVAHHSCQICRTWRKIAFSTPVLWRAVSEFLPRGFFNPKEVETELHWLKTSLARSGSCSLSIDLVPASPIEHPEPLPFVHTIASHCVRWEHLTLFVSASQLRSMRVSPLSSLRSLSILLYKSVDDTAPHFTAFLTAPLLRKVLLLHYENVYHAIMPSLCRSQPERSMTLSLVLFD